MRIKILPIEFTKRGVYYKQFKRSGDIAIYSLCYTAGQIIGWDCIKVLSYTPNYDLPFFAQRKGDKWACIETYPTSESFGSKAWSYDTLEKAENKFQELIGDN